MAGTGPFPDILDLIRLSGRNHEVDRQPDDDDPNANHSVDRSFADIAFGPPDEREECRK
jgi:hypothetical protein